MRRQSALWGVFVSRFHDALERFRRRRLSADEAGELLGVSGRQFRRQQTHRHHYVRATVRVHQYPDGASAIFDGPRCLGRYDRDAKLIEPTVPRAA